ncbi:hypothetical protein Moror_4780 [Moniliophthora roreri MCA 2997]|uniref:Uncharacterized protein n=1 Tax=Moniliophthora roreri (strain MCA 2997) TaxID=1381753 RepID=V2YKD5_MONRO|nr:hypothetical protein Moror_4780 [Moniliophthora roreri MCA 2997]
MMDWSGLCIVCIPESKNTPSGVEEPVPVLFRKTLSLHLAQGTREDSPTGLLGVDTKILQRKLASSIRYTSFAIVTVFSPLNHLVEWEEEERLLITRDGREPPAVVTGAFKDGIREGWDIHDTVLIFGLRLKIGFNVLCMGAPQNHHDPTTP